MKIRVKRYCRAQPAGATLGADPSKYERLIQKAKGAPAATTIVVHSCDENSLRGAVEAVEAGIIIPTLVGPVAKITTTASDDGLDISAIPQTERPGSPISAKVGISGISAKRMSPVTA